MSLACALASGSRLRLDLSRESTSKGSIRTECVCCLKSVFTTVYTEVGIPLSFITMSGVKNDHEEEVVSDLEWVQCSNCGCVQLRNLAPLDVLYKVPHNDTCNTETWKNHHVSFATFCNSGISPYKKIVEIGGGVGSHLGTLLDNKDYRNIEFQDNFNLETDSFAPSPQIVIMSHCLEHLYKPLECLRNLAREGIEEIYLSIPNLEYLFSTNSFNFIHAEHTFYYDMRLLGILFSGGGWKMSEFKSFGNHSLFIKLVQKPIGVFETLGEYFSNRSSKLGALEIKRATFVVPGGHFLTHILAAKPKGVEFIMGAIDNDKGKCGRRMYGTNGGGWIYQWDFVKEYYPQPNIILVDCPYKKELEEQIERTFKKYSIQYLTL